MKFGFIGAGMWGSAFASALIRDGHSALMWDRNHKSGLEGAQIVASPLDLKQVDVTVIAIPFQAISAFLSDSAAAISSKCLILSKGIEKETLLLGHQLIAQYRPEVAVGVISGPNFASEIIAGLPAVTVLASLDADVASIFGERICNIKVCHSKDVIGVELCAALKNVVAVGCGMIDGLNLGRNLQAAFLQECFCEIGKIVEACGGDKHTMEGPAGIGDLVLTCNSTKSRNYTAGVDAASGNSVADATVEGLETARTVQALAGALGLKTPTLCAVQQALDNIQNLKEIMIRLF